MASLTQTAILTRKIIRFTIYFIIFLIIGRIALGLAITLIQKLFPSPPPAPTVQFGKLPSLSFPIGNNTPPLTYIVQTPEGGLPTLASQAKVYFMPQSHSDLLALDNTKQKAASLGFAGTPKQITPTIYEFTNGLSTLEMNIVTGTFSIGFNLNADQSPLTQIPPTANIASGVAKNFMSQASLLPDDLSGPVTEEYLKVQNKQLVTAISQSEGNLIKINFFRRSYDKLISVTPNPNQGNVWFVLSGSNEQSKQIIGAQYYYYPVDVTRFETYPLKTADQAFKDLQANHGFIANLGQNKNKVIIRRVYLAYYDAGVPEQFYQPVIVFEGDNGFVAYVPAVTSTYYGE
jgi:hypothetical protein